MEDLGVGHQAAAMRGVTNSMGPILNDGPASLRPCRPARVHTPRTLPFPSFPGKTVSWHALLGPIIGIPGTCGHETVSGNE